MSTNIELDEIDENENNPLMLEKKAAEEQGRRKRRVVGYKLRCGKAVDL